MKQEKINSGKTSAGKKIRVMAHLVAGYPNLEDSLRLAETLADSGAAILEIQIPFSEPVADGQTIVEACHIALERGFKTKDIFGFCGKVAGYIQSKGLDIPIVVMSYANPILSIGIESFCAELKKVGVSGLIVPDLPFDSKEGEELRVSAEKHGLDLIQVVSVSMSLDRLKKAATLSSGMIYCTTKRGTTGGTVLITEELKEIVSAIRKVSDIDIALGFGISSKEEVEAVGELADVAVIGSAILRKFNGGKGEGRFGEVKGFLRRIN